MPPVFAEPELQPSRILGIDRYRALPAVAPQFGSRREMESQRAMVTAVALQPVGDDPFGKARPATNTKHRPVMRDRLAQAPVALVHAQCKIDPLASNPATTLRIEQARGNR